MYYTLHNIENLTNLLPFIFPDILVSVNWGIVIQGHKEKCNKKKV